MKTTLYIQNLKCGGCERTIIKKLSSIGGIENVSIHHEDASVSFKYKVDDQIEIVSDTLSRLGYPVRGHKNNFVKKAKSYVSCVEGRLDKN